jgi:hypothetical protein
MQPLCTRSSHRFMQSRVLVCAHVLWQSALRCSCACVHELAGMGRYDNLTSGRTVPSRRQTSAACTHITDTAARVIDIMCTPACEQLDIAATHVIHRACSPRQRASHSHLQHYNKMKVVGKGTYGEVSRAQLKGSNASCVAPPPPPPRLHNSDRM